MLRQALATLLILLCSTAVAQPTTIAVDKELLPGYYVLKILGDGTATLKKVEDSAPVLVLGSTTIPTFIYTLDILPPDDPTDPDSDKIKELKEVVHEATDRVKDSNKEITKSRLAAVYSSTALLPLGSKENFHIAVDAIFAATVLQLEVSDEWGAWKGMVTEALNKFSLDDFPKALIAIGKALS